MRVSYAVTFEFETRAPVTHRSTVEGWAASTCASRAVKEAQKALTPVNWTSMVCVLLERVDTAHEADAEQAEFDRDNP